MLLKNQHDKHENEVQLSGWQLPVSHQDFVHVKIFQRWQNLRGYAAIQ